MFRRDVNYNKLKITRNSLSSGEGWGEVIL